MNYVIIGSALSGNKGAAAMLESSIQTLSKSDNNAQFTLLSMYPTEDARLNTYKNLKIIPAKPLQLGLIINPLALLYRILPPLRPLLRGTSKSVRALAESDTLLDQGGITFTDGREKFLIYNIASILPGLLIGTKVIKCAQALGPFNNPINRLMAKMFLPRMQLIVARGKITHEHLKGLGLKNITLGADYAFALGITKKERKSAKETVDMSFFESGRTVGISPSVVIKKKLDKREVDYIGITAEFINWLIDERGYKVSLIPHSIRTGTNKTHNNDLPMSQEIYTHINNKDKCLFINQELSSQELRYVIGQNDLFIASRFHAMVSALAMQVPVMVLGWSHKYKEVLDMFGLEGFAYDYKNISHETMQADFIKLEESKVKQKKKYKEYSEKVTTASKKQASDIASLLNEKSNHAQQ